MKFFKSFYYAGRGIVTALSQRNFRFHLCAAAFVIFFAARFYSFTAERWAILLMTCAAVLALETVNTGIEKLADKVTEENSHRIKLAKDCAAGAVLIAAIGAAAVGIALFWNTDIFGLILLYFTEPARLAALIMALALAWGFIFLPEYWRKGK
ncbi:MAG: diacylglycerol kinase family protein [Oscillospiraceae bacterium]|nr:diacylglycerol kinase family protein [Oscillospiraceae bacterium]